MLFKNSDTVKEYAQISGTVDLTAMRATINFVEDQHIQSILGKELYTSLKEAYADAATDADLVSPELTDLLEQCRKVIGPMLCYYYAPKVDIQISDSGVQRIETTTNKTAFQYQNTNFAQANLREGEACTELLIEYLEDHRDSFPQWRDSKAFEKYRSLFIKTGKEFDELYTSHTPYRNYWAIRAKMFDVEENNIRELLGDTMYDAMKVKDRDDDYEWTEIEAKLVTRIKKAIAYLTVAFAIPMLNVRIESNGLSVVAFSSFSTNEKDNTRSGADDNARTELIRACNASGQVWINNAVNFITANPDEFSDWKGFPATPVDNSCSINDELTGSFGLM
ncbi:MAG: DUF6712 family protein [Bacteroidota bacterium]